MKKRPIEERFWEKIDRPQTTDCWLWTSVKNNKGYGLFTVSAAAGKILAHRMAYELTNGPIPANLSVMHSCDTPACVNPAHLSIGTHKDNLADMSRKGRWGNAGAQGSEVGTAKLTDERVVSIREAYISGTKIGDIADEFGVSRPTIKRVVSGQTWKHLFGVKGPSLEELKAAKRTGGWLPKSEQKLTAQTAKELKSLFDTGMTDQEIAEKFNLSRRYVCDIRNGRNWASV